MSHKKYNKIIEADHKTYYCKVTKVHENVFVTQDNEQLQERASENMCALKNMMHFVRGKAK